MANAHSFPYLQSTAKLNQIFESLRQSKVSDKLTYRQLSALGFPSSKDRPIIPFLIKLGFLNASSALTQNYFYIKDQGLLLKYLNNKIAEVYSDIFSHKECVPNVSDDVLAGIFMEVSAQTPGTCLAYAKTMRVLIEYCGFSYEKHINKDNLLKKKSILPKINISINLPTTTDDAVYEKLFKHLKDLLVP